jgi:O-antigen/teichoic acid export membrane protein
MAGEGAPPKVMDSDGNVASRPQLQITSRLLLRNTALSFGGNLLPLLVGLATIPVILRSLGTERFGLLSLVWLVLGYFTIFELGVGRASVRFVGKALGEGRADQVQGIVWTTLTLLALLGTLGGAVLAALTPLLSDRILNLPAGLVAEARSTLFVLCGALPVALITVGLKGVLEAGQRFDLVNAVKIPLASLTFVIPAAAAPLDFSLPQIVLLLLLARVGAAAAYLAMCLRVFPHLRQWFALKSRWIRPLLTYGGWITIATAGNALVAYLDRFFIAWLLPIAAVAHYTVPFDVVTQLSIFPLSVLAVLFPALSTFAGSQQLAQAESTVARSLKYLLLIMGPIVLVTVSLAHAGLSIWLGSEFASASGRVLQILAIGILVASLAAVPCSLLQSAGRPDLPAKLCLLELLVYVGVLWLFISNFGIAGAALAWTLRATTDAGLLFGACIRLKLLSFRSLGRHGLLRSIAAVAILAAMLGGSLPLVTAALVRLVILAALLAAFAFVAWRYIGDAAEKRALATAARNCLGIILPRYSTR